MPGKVELGAAVATNCGNEVDAANTGSVGVEGDNGPGLFVFFKLLDLPSQCWVLLKPYYSNKSKLSSTNAKIRNPTSKTEQPEACTWIDDI